MGYLAGLSIRTKLTLLAGVPVVGALVLAALIALDADRQVETAVALGSIEGVAQLSVYINRTIHALQVERADGALKKGWERSEPSAPRPVGASPPPTTLRADADGTDEALQQLDRFLSGRDLSKLPPRLAGDLRAAHTRLAGRQELRARLSHEDVSLDEIVSFYGDADDALVSATAALSELSDDGELLRRVSSLVALAQLAERASQEHALLSYVFARGEFPPGEFKHFVTLTTEQEVYAAAFRANAGVGELAEYDALQKSAVVARVDALRNTALRATDDNFGVDPRAWHVSAQERVSRLEDIQRDLLAQITHLATRKMQTTRAAVRLGLVLSAAVVVVSTLLGVLISRGITLSIGALSTAAASVREKKDFSTRAPRTSNDELGDLTDAFNEMLATIEQRDADLEGQVAARTEDLRRTVAELWSEMELARKIQTVLLPQSLDFPGYKVAARMIPAATVGGDYFDVIRIGGTDWILIGDVSGHGVTAGLSMMILQTAVRTVILSAAFGATALGPSQLLCRVNAAIQENLRKIHPEQYITVMALKFDGRRVTYAGAHQDILVYRVASNTVERLESRGVWIGLLEEIDGLVEDDSFEMNPGDVLLLYTDGLTEALVDGRRPGTTGLAATLGRLAGTDAEVDAIVEGFLARSDGLTFEDDATAVVAQCVAAPGQEAIDLHSPPV
jgi:serine phosphatase RsbU (regulator of sigma subunit)